MIRRLFRKRDRFDDLLTDAAGGRLDADGMRQLDALAAQNAERQAARDETLALTRLLRSQPPAPVPRSFALSAPPEPRRAPALPRPLQALTATAAVVLVALIAADYATAPSSGLPATAQLTAAMEGAQDSEPTAESAEAPDDASQSEAMSFAAREPEADSDQSSESASAPAPIGAAPPKPESAAAREWRALDWAVAAAGLATAALALAHLTAVWLARRCL